MKKQNIIGWDYTGCIGSPKKTSLKRLVEYKLGAEEGQKHWEGMLKRFCSNYKDTWKEHGEDSALLSFYNELIELGIQKEDYSIVAKLLMREGLIREPVLNAMATLNNLGATNIIVTKNLKEELEAFADYVNDTYQKDIISFVIGTKGEYNNENTLTGIATLIGDKRGKIKGVNRILKRDAMKNADDYSFVTDTGDYNIRELSKKSVVIRSNFSYASLDEYFQISAKGTGRYQDSIITDYVWDAVLSDNKNLEANLVGILS